MKKGRTIKTPWDHLIGTSPKLIKKPAKKNPNEKYWDERIKLGKQIGKETGPISFEE